MLYQSANKLLVFYVISHGVFNLFIPGSAKSKTGKGSKSTNGGKLKNKQHRSEVLLNSFSMHGFTFRFLSIESKVGKLCIVSPKVHLGVKGLKVCFFLLPRKEIIPLE